MKNDNYPDPSGPEIQECFPVKSEDKNLDIITWNIHQLPVQDENVLAKFTLMINISGADILAVQEAGSAGDFSKLMAELPGYDGFINSISEQNCAFIVKKNGPLNLIGIRPLFEDDPYAFPRPLLVMSLTDRENDTIYMINIHLKCCEGPENEERRIESLNKMKRYADSLMAGQRVIILGDFNEELSGEAGKKVFREYLSDSLHYWFADMSLAVGPPDDWSYPEWPSHLDHFLISDEWREYEYSVNCLKPDLCDSTYFTTISDHRPVRLEIRLAE